jgi:tripartite-type tricarboxylate transporter receptor subunit TctC
VIENEDMRRFSRLCALLVAMTLAPLAPRAVAQDYPARPIRVIATSSAGGTSDIFMRALAEELHKRLGQPVIVENRPGGARPWRSIRRTDSSRSPSCSSLPRRWW